MATFISHSPAETESLGEVWGRAAPSGLVIALSGDLGAGKTQLVKGLARGLGISARVQSPSFALVNIYPPGRLWLFHLDLYRLETREQIRAAGLEEYLHPEGVTVIEWAERWFGDWREPFDARHPHGNAENPKPEVRSPKAGRNPNSENRTDAVPAHSETADETSHSSLATRHPLLRRVWIETLSETERRITYEDSGA